MGKIQKVHAWVVCVCVCVCCVCLIESVCVHVCHMLSLLMYDYENRATDVKTQNMSS